MAALTSESFDAELEPLGDEDLALAAGDRKRYARARRAFDLLATRYHRRLIGLLRTRGVQGHPADEVAQLVWIAAWNGLPGWTAGHFRGWLFTIARNRATDWLRRPEAKSVDPARDVPDPRPSVPDADSVAKLQKCVGRVPDPYKEPLLLFMGGVPYEEIATQLDRPLNTVKGQIHRARKSVADCAGIDWPPPTKGKTET